MASEQPRLSTVLSFQSIAPLIIVALIATGVYLFAASYAIDFVATFKVKVGYELTLAMIALGAVSILLVLYNDRIWVISAVGLHALILVGKTEGIGLTESLFIMSVLVGLAAWFVKHMIIMRETVVRTGFDLLFISFFVIVSSLCITMNLVNGGRFLLGLKELTLAFDMLLYFPLRSVLHTQRDVKKVLLVFTSVAIINGLINISHYRERLAQAVFQYEVQASRMNANEPTSIAMLMICIALFAYSKKLKLTIVAQAGVAAALVFLAITFSRGATLAGLIGAIAAIAIFPPKVRWRGALSLVLSVVLGVGAITLIFPKIAQNVRSGIAARLGTVTSVRTDISYQARVVESNTLLNKYIAASPILGYGYGVLFKFEDPITSSTTATAFIHNGYTAPMYKFGIPLAILFFFMIAYPMLRLGIRHPARRDTFYYAVTSGCIGYYISAAIVNYTSNQFTQYSSIPNFAVCWALLDFVNRSVIESDAEQDREMQLANNGQRFSNALKLGTTGNAN